MDEAATAVKTINKEDLLQKVQKGEAVQIVNVLDPEYYVLGVIPESQKIPLAHLEQRLGELDRSKEVITYCASHECTASSRAAKILAESGFNVKAYEGGIKEWTEAGYPVEQ
jgi:ArsR family transcriptional regulator